jgi:hypothetical protein
MDVVSQLALKKPLFRLHGAEALFRSVAFAGASDSLIEAAHRCETPVVLTGPAGVGKSLLLGDVGRRLAAEGVKVVSWASPAGFSDAASGVLIIDEADTATPARLREIAEAAKRRGATAIFAAVDPRWGEGAARSVRLGPMSGREAEDFLLEAAAAAGRPDLFTPAAQDAIVAAACGIPRVLKTLANGAVLEAVFEEVEVVDARHVATAVAAKSPLPAAEPDYAYDPPPYHPRPQAAPPPRPIVLTEPAPKAAVDDDADADTAMPMRMPPLVDERAPRSFALGARGTIIGGAALVLLVAAAGAYAIDTVGVGRVADWVRVQLGGVTAPSTGNPTVPRAAPGRPTISSDLATVEPLAAPPTLETAAIAVETAVPAPAFEAEATGAAEPAVDAPPLPDPSTPGYRPPSPTLPTIAAARRAGIPTTQDRDGPRAARGAEPDTVRIEPTVPLSDAPAPSLSTVDVGLPVDD